MYLILNITIPFAVVACLAYAAFCQRVKQAKKMRILLSTGMLFACFILGVVMSVIKINNFVYVVAFTLLTLLYFKLSFRCTIYEFLYVFFIIKSYMDDVFSLSKAFQTYSGHFIVFPDNTSHFFFSYGVVLTLSMPLIWFFMHRTVKQLICHTENMLFWKYIWLVPVSFYLIYRMAISPAYPTSEMVWSKAEVLLPLVWTITTFIVYILMTNMALEIAKSAAARAELQITGQLIKSKNEQYDQIQKSVEAATQMRHDLRHHLLALEGYLKEKDSANAQRYLQSVVGQLKSSEPNILCENYAVNAILSTYLSKAQKRGAKITTALNIPPDLPHVEKDLCVIMGNLVENAVEACERQHTQNRFIQIKASFTDKQNFCIIIKNSFDHAILYDKDGHRLSSKSSLGDRRKGVGLSSINHIIKKYNGTLRCEIKNQTYKVFVRLEFPVP